MKSHRMEYALDPGLLRELRTIPGDDVERRSRPGRPASLARHLHPGPRSASRTLMTRMRFGLIRRLSVQARQDLARALPACGTECRPCSVRRASSRSTPTRHLAGPVPVAWRNPPRASQVEVESLPPLVLAKAGRWIHTRSATLRRRPRPVFGSQGTYVACCCRRG